MLKRPLSRTLQVYRHLSTMSFPSTVQSITIANAGDFDVIEKTVQPFPQQPAGHVIIKVQYAGVNFIDTYFRKGLYPVDKFPYTLGQESAGTVVALPTDEVSLNDEEFKKRNIKLGIKAIGYYSGAFSEYVSLPWYRVFPIPGTVSVKTGAASLLQGLTALTFLTEAYSVKKGDTILIHAIAGGFGLVASQIAKTRGAIVIGTTSTEEKAELAKAHGADHVVLYRTEDTVQRVLEITNGEGVAAVFDGVGKDTFDNNFKLLKRKGTLVSLGNASGAVPPFSPLKLSEKNLKILRPVLPNYIYTPEEGRLYSAEMFDLISKGSVKINIFKEYPFTAQGVQNAQKDITGGKTTGKLLIKVSDD